MLHFYISIYCSVLVEAIDFIRERERDQLHVRNGRQSIIARSFNPFHSERGNFQLTTHPSQQTPSDRSKTNVHLAGGQLISAKCITAFNCRQNGWIYQFPTALNQTGPCSVRKPESFSQWMTNWRPSSPLPVDDQLFENIISLNSIMRSRSQVCEVGRYFGFSTHWSSVNVSIGEL